MISKVAIAVAILAAFCGFMFIHTNHAFDPATLKRIAQEAFDK